MRYVIIILLLVPGFVFAQPAEVRQVELSKVSRGYEEHIRITPDSLHVFTENKMGEKPVTDFSRMVSEKEWTRLVEVVRIHPVKELRDLPSPTMKRAHDAAMHSTITIHMADGTSVTHGYDDENPHVAFLPILKEIRTLSSVPGKP
jgi:hypothetical protein